MSTTTPTIKPTTTPISADYEITITLKEGHAVPPSPIPIMTVGETVRYSSGAGEVRILFLQRSPFRTDDLTMTSVPGSVILTLVSDSGSGTLPCGCFITPPGGTELGWGIGLDNELSGGNHKVTEP
jgi:hypothetical protein